jgi:hypothetical protein
MTTALDAIRTAILEGAPGDELGALPLPESSRGALVREEDQEMFAGFSEEELTVLSGYLDRITANVRLAPEEYSEAFDRRFREAMRHIQDGEDEG